MLYKCHVSHYGIAIHIVLLFYSTSENDRFVYNSSIILHTTSMRSSLTLDCRCSMILSSIVTSKWICNTQVMVQTVLIKDIS